MAFPMLALRKSFRNGGGKQWTRHLPQGFEAAMNACVAATPALTAEAAKAAPTPGGAAAGAAAGSGESGPSVLGNVWALARDAAGCRAVQSVLEDGDDDVRRSIAKEFTGRVLEAMECPHANHVLQKCCVMLRPSEMQFILDELDNRPQGVLLAMQHKYGCRVVKRLLECGSKDQVRHIASALLAECHAMATHPYGTFVVQHLFYHADEEQQAALFSELQAHVQALCRSSHGAAVIHVALCQCDASWVKALCRSILAVPGLLAHMGCLRHGCPAAIELVGMLEDMDAELHQAARAEAAAHRAVLGGCRYGRQVLGALGLSQSKAETAKAAEATTSRAARAARAGA